MKIADSSRLTYRLMGSDDAALFFELDQDVEVMRYINHGKIPSMEDIHNIFMPRLKSYTIPEEGCGIWQVTIRETNAYIGWILVRPMHFFTDNYSFENLELGWRFKKSSWGKGYATEAAKCITHAFVSKSNIAMLTAIAFPENVASINIMKKLGMKYIKTDLHKDPLGDEEVVFYELVVATNHK